METNHSGGYSDNEDKSVQKKPDNTEALVQTGATVTDALLSDIRALIEQARERMAQTVNAELVILNWHIGKRIQKDVLAQERAEYGKQIVKGSAFDN